MHQADEEPLALPQVRLGISAYLVQEYECVANVMFLNMAAAPVVLLASGTTISCLAQGTNQNIISIGLGYLCRVRLKFNVKLK